jgi:hypothetical protein
MALSRPDNNPGALPSAHARASTGRSRYGGDCGTLPPAHPSATRAGLARCSRSADLDCHRAGSRSRPTRPPIGPMPTSHRRLLAIKPCQASKCLSFAWAGRLYDASLQLTAQLLAAARYSRSGCTATQLALEHRSGPRSVGPVHVTVVGCGACGAVAWGFCDRLTCRASDDSKS